MLVSDTCLVDLLHPEGDPKKGAPEPAAEDSDRREDVVGRLPNVIGGRVVCRSVVREAAYSARTRGGCQRVRRPRARTRGDLNIFLDLYLERGGRRRA